jgi:hypothetical protein
MLLQLLLQYWLQLLLRCSGTTFAHTAARTVSRARTHHHDNKQQQQTSIESHETSMHQRLRNIRVSTRDEWKWLHAADRQHLRPANLSDILNTIHYEETHTIGVPTACPQLLTGVGRGSFTACPGQ